MERSISGAGVTIGQVAPVVPMRCPRFMPNTENTMPSEPATDEPDVESFATHAARVLGLPIDPDWRGPIVANLRVLQAAADLVSGFPLPDEAEAAPVFVA